MKLYGAIDLHSNNSVTVLTDEQDHVVYEKRLPNDLALITQQLSAYRESLEGIVVESTYNWYWLVDGLIAAGYDVRLANTVAMKRYDGLKHSGDAEDAAHLAHLLRLGILPTGYIHPPAHRALREGGMLLIAEISPNEDRTAPAFAALFSLNMLVASPGGDVFTLKEMRGWLADAGFRKSELLRVPAPSPLILATK